MIRPLIIRTRHVGGSRYRAWATVDGRRMQRTVTVPNGTARPHAWAADRFAPTVGAVADSTPCWGAAALPTVAFQAWA